MSHAAIPGAQPFSSLKRFQADSYRYPRFLFGNRRPRHQRQNQPAQDFFRALTKAGVEARSGVNTSYLKVTRVECQTGGGIVFLPMPCTLVDESCGRTFRADGAIAAALERAGVKSVTTLMGELHETRVGARVSECKTLFNGMAGCSIEF